MSFKVDVAFSNLLGWAEDLSHFGLSTVKSVSIMNSPDQCNNYHMVKVDKTRVDNMANACWTSSNSLANLSVFIQIIIKNW